MTAAVGWCDNGTHGEFTHAYGELVAYSTLTGTLTHRLRQQSGPLIDQGRNHLVEQFLATDADYLLQLDADTVPPVDALERLVAHDVPIVTGLYYGYRPEVGQFPYLYRLDGDDYKFHLAWEPGDVFEVDACGAGLLLIHRDVFLKVDEPFRRDGTVGEDMSFCRRAAEAGFTIVADTGVESGHIRKTLLNTGTYRG